MLQYMHLCHEYYICFLMGHKVPFANLQRNVSLFYGKCISVLNHFILFCPTELIPVLCL